jgi:N-methylhydantoinase A
MGRSDVAQKGRRPIYLPETRGFELVPVYDRYALTPGSRFAGPAIVEERESTAVIGPGALVAVDEWLNLVIQMPR